MKKEILEKFLNNSCTETEFEEVVQWVKTKAHSKKGRELVFDDWKSYQPLGNNNKHSTLLDKIHHEINLRHYRNKKNDVLLLKRATTWLTRVAAILMLPVLGVLLYMISNRNLEIEGFAEAAIDTIEIVAPVGSRTIVQLSDGTEVNLNYGSKIRYPRTFKGDKRELTLVGEGYFDVATNPQMPFVVNTNKLNVKAIGTKFNVQAYPDNDEIGTTLVEGKVVIEEKMERGEYKTIGLMEPRQHVSYNINTGKIISTKGDVAKYIDWIDGKLVFDNEPITKVVQRLERMFNVDIEVADDIKDYTYTVTFVNESLNQILDLMTKVTPITYEITERKKLADGTFSQQKIIIKKQKLK